MVRVLSRALVVCVSAVALVVSCARIADAQAVTVLNHEQFVRGTDIQAIFVQLNVDDPEHAFYLGKELARASLAVSLGKTYRQEGALAWGYLTPQDDAVSDHVRLSQTAKRPRR